ncbi:MAG: ADP-ribosylglycohydrolase family protein [Opitutales bacterium]|nr:ADP-ribosylglycohydrolase family protein [Opitutales bacterium]
MSKVFQNAFLGSLVADALSMPVHWYYDTTALDRDYGAITGYQAPRNPHPDSILWRSSYQPINDRGEILHDQARFWGQKGVHYHQFLEAGENTLNYQLGIELYRWIIMRGGYSEKEWLDHYIEVMQTPGWHKDTYVEEVHRNFFTHYARGKKPMDCSVKDLHIGALSQVPALIAGLDALGDPAPEELTEVIKSHVRLTHNHPESIEAATLLVRLLCDLNEGKPLRESIASRAVKWTGATTLKDWEKRSDREVVGSKVSTACYLPEAMTASLHFVWKYEQDFATGIQANAQVGGDNCHRAAIVGGLLGGELGVPEDWLFGLKAMEALRCDQGLKPIKDPDF